jgi:hypothetical protein
MKGVFDSDIVIDYLNEEEQASDTLAAYDDKVVSRVTWMEVLVRTADAAEEARIRSMLTRFRVVELTPSRNVQSSYGGTILRNSNCPTRLSTPPRKKKPAIFLLATRETSPCRHPTLPFPTRSSAMPKPKKPIKAFKHKNVKRPYSVSGRSWL